MTSYLPSCLFSTPPVSDPPVSFYPTSALPPRPGLGAAELVDKVGLARACPVMHASASSWPKAPKRNSPPPVTPSHHPSCFLLIYLRVSRLTPEIGQIELKSKESKRQGFLRVSLSSSTRRQSSRPRSRYCFLKRPVLCSLQSQLWFDSGKITGSPVTTVQATPFRRSALTWLRSSTPFPERPRTEPPNSCPATTSACICRGATNCAAP
ncbi:hypothetical protein B0T25DRAFT_30228 [Lasiosphaeria hispida]|uniref:Uncharacterized protein n=1 Tax=Lasiosphaeria hispida TaxID=260671 RepID=A0AAJ0HUF0_9PEZI|nr:hypothetical protein B0T25DRAFT_30228 [Lasiosphaeria hispida]